ncbi:hypothetical protein SMG44B_10565 [Stenotrophomonas maltophilia]
MEEPRQPQWLMANTFIYPSSFINYS